MRRAWPHVFKEGNKAVTPTIAHCDATAAIVAVLSCGRTEATRLDVDPRDVLWRLRLAVRAKACNEKLGTPTTATRRIPRCQVFAEDTALLAAITSTQPTGTHTIIERATRDEETTEPLSSKIVEFHLPSVTSKQCDERKYLDFDNGSRRSLGIFYVPFDG